MLVPSRFTVVLDPRVLTPWPHSQCCIYVFYNPFRWCFSMRLTAWNVQVMLVRICLLLGAALADDSWELKNSCNFLRSASTAPDWRCQGLLHSMAVDLEDTMLDKRQCNLAPVFQLILNAFKHKLPYWTTVVPGGHTVVNLSPPLVEDAISTTQSERCVQCRCIPCSH